MARSTDSLTEAEIRSLLERDEGQFIEFKSLWDRSNANPRTLDRRSARDLVVEVVAAFANADGGTLLLGVDDDGTPSGHGYPEEAVLDLLSAPEKRLRPAVACRTQRAQIDGKEILIFEVPIASEAVMVEGNGFPQRVGDRVSKEPQEVINARKEAYRRVGFEQRIRPGATLDDLDLELAEAFLARTVYKDRSVEDVLQRYSLAIPAARSLAITNACLLLFGKEPFARWHPRAGVRLFRVAGKERKHGVERNVTQLGRVDGPMARALPEAHAVARRQIQRSEVLRDLFFREMPEYPEFAWQEAIVNAVAHRDYEDQSREIEVWFFDDRMEVRSPGEPIPPVTVDLLRAHRPVHATRNPLIVRLLADASLMREEGEGVPRMFEEMERSSLRAPVFSVEANALGVALYNEPIRVSGDLRETQAFLAARIPVLRAHLERSGSIKNADYRELFEVTRVRAVRELRQLVDGGYLRPVGEKRGARYAPGPALANPEEK